MLSKMAGATSSAIQMLVKVAGLEIAVLAIVHRDRDRDRRAGDRSYSYPHRRANEDGVIYGLPTALTSCASPHLLCTPSPALLRCHTGMPHGDLPRRPVAAHACQPHALPSFACLFIRSQPGSPCRRSCWTRNGHRSFLTNHTPSGLLDEPYPVRPPSVHVVGTLRRAMNGVSRGFRGATEEPPTAGWT